MKDREILIDVAGRVRSLEEKVEDICSAKGINSGYIITTAITVASVVIAYALGKWG